MNTGIVGAASLNGKHNKCKGCSSEDERFNKSVDLKTGYRTKQLLVVPVVSSSGTIEVINQKATVPVKMAKSMF